MEQSIQHSVGIQEKLALCFLSSFFLSRKRKRSLGDASVSYSRKPTLETDVKLTNSLNRDTKAKRRGWSNTPNMQQSRSESEAAKPSNRLVSSTPQTHSLNQRCLMRLDLETGPLRQKAVVLIRQAQCSKKKDPPCENTARRKLSASDAESPIGLVARAVIPSTTGRLRQEEPKFKASNSVKPYLKIKGLGLVFKQGTC